jgi:uncharacterized protein with NRDE domain
VFSPTQAGAKAQHRQEKGANETPIAYDSAALITNSGGGGAITCRLLSEQERTVGGLSNGVDGHGASDWLKVKEGRSELQQLLDALDSKGGDVDESELVEGLFNILTCVSLSTPRSRNGNTVRTDAPNAQIRCAI